MCKTDNAGCLRDSSCPSYSTDQQNRIFHPMNEENRKRRKAGNKDCCHTSCSDRGSCTSWWPSGQRDKAATVFFSSVKNWSQGLGRRGRGEWAQPLSVSVTEIFSKGKDLYDQTEYQCLSLIESFSPLFPNPLKR